jgi:hypothetical protein
MVHCRFSNSAPLKATKRYICPCFWICLYKPMETYCGVEVDFGPSWMLVVSFTPRPFCHLRNRPPPPGVLNHTIRVYAHRTCCEQGNEPSDSIEGGEFLYYLNDNQLLKDSVGWNEHAVTKLYAICILVTRDRTKHYSVRFKYRCLRRKRDPCSQPIWLIESCVGPCGPTLQKAFKVRLNPCWHRSLLRNETRSATEWNSGYSPKRFYTACSRRGGQYSGRYIVSVTASVV